MQRSTISFYSDLSFLKRGTRTAILSRTNMGLFKNAMHLRAKRQSFCFERDIKVELMKTLDVYRLHCGEKEKIRDELIQSFDSLVQLDKYAEQIQNFQLSNISQIVKQYASEFPGAIFEMIKLTKENGDQNDREAVILSTVHTAKGQEYERVIIDADIAEAINRTAGKNAKEFHDEVNVAYVCLTRVKGQLFLPMAMKTLLTPTWRHYMEGLIPKVSTLYIAGKNDGKKYGAEPKTSRFSKRSAVPNQLTYSVGDRVRTSNGYGTIVAIVGAQYHIALEGQVARMRENLTALNFYNH